MEIRNCIGKGWANSCSECEKGFVYEFDGVIKFDSCVVNFVEFCWTSEKNAVDKCLICKVGFVLSPLNSCETI